MLTKGIIKQIDFTGNTCTVRIPLFETAQSSEFIVTATIATQPGIYNGYKEGDIVYVGFENDTYEEPIIIGKLFLGAEKEGKEPRGTINTESLTANTTAKIPFDTKLLNNVDPNIPNTQVNYTSIQKLTNMTDSTKNLLDKTNNDFGNQINQIITGQSELGEELTTAIRQTKQSIVLEAQRAEDAEAKLEVEADKITAKVSGKLDTNSKDTPGETESFGWNLTYNEWVVFSESTLLEQNLKEARLTKKQILEYNSEIKEWELSKENYWHINGQPALVETKIGEKTIALPIQVEDSIDYTLTYWEKPDSDPVEVYWQLVCENDPTKNKITTNNALVRPILITDRTGLFVNGSINAIDGHIGKFIIGKTENSLVKVQIDDAAALNTTVKDSKTVFYLAKPDFEVLHKITYLTGTDDYSKYYDTDSIYFVHDTGPTKKENSAIYSENYIERFAESAYAEFQPLGSWKDPDPTKTTHYGIQEKDYIPGKFLTFNESEARFEIINQDWSKAKQFFKLPNSTATAFTRPVYTIKTGVYVGTDGIKLGNKFSISPDGKLTVKQIIFEDDAYAQIVDKTKASNINLVEGNVTGENIVLNQYATFNTGNYYVSKNNLATQKFEFDALQYPIFDLSTREFNICENISYAGTEIVGQPDPSIAEIKKHTDYLRYYFDGSLISSDYQNSYRALFSPATLAKNTLNQLTLNFKNIGDFTPSRTWEQKSSLFSNYVLEFPQISKSSETNAFYNFSFLMKLTPSTNLKNAYSTFINTKALHSTFSVEAPLLFANFENKNLGVKPSAYVNTIKLVSTKVGSNLHNYDSNPYAVRASSSVFRMPAYSHFDYDEGETIYSQAIITCYDIDGREKEELEFSIPFGTALNVPVGGNPRATLVPAITSLWGKDALESRGISKKTSMSDALVAWLQGQDLWVRVGITVRSSQQKSLIDLSPRINILFPQTGDQQEHKNENWLVSIKNIAVTQGYLPQPFEISGSDTTKAIGGGMGGVFELANTTDWSAYPVGNNPVTFSQLSLDDLAVKAAAKNNTYSTITGTDLKGDTHTLWVLADEAGSLSAQKFTGTVKSHTIQKQGIDGKTTVSSQVNLYQATGSSTAPVGVSIGTDKKVITGNWKTTIQKPTATQQYVWTTSYNTVSVDGVWTEDVLDGQAVAGKSKVTQYSTLEDMISILASDGIDIIYKYDSRYYLKADVISGAMSNKVTVGGFEIGPNTLKSTSKTQDFVSINTDCVSYTTISPILDSDGSTYSGLIDEADRYMLVDAYDQQIIARQFADTKLELTPGMHFYPVNCLAKKQNSLQIVAKQPLAKLNLYCGLIEPELGESIAISDFATNAHAPTTQFDGKYDVRTTVTPIITDDNQKLPITALQKITFNNVSEGAKLYIRHFVKPDFFEFLDYRPDLLHYTDNSYRPCCDCWMLDTTHGQASGTEIDDDPNDIWNATTFNDDNIGLWDCWSYGGLADRVYDYGLEFTRIFDGGWISRDCPYFARFTLKKWALKLGDLQLMCIGSGNMSINVKLLRINPDTGKEETKAVCLGGHSSSMQWGEDDDPSYYVFNKNRGDDWVTYADWFVEGLALYEDWGRWYYNSTFICGSGMHKTNNQGELVLFLEELVDTGAVVDSNVFNVSNKFRVSSTGTTYIKNLTADSWQTNVIEESPQKHYWQSNMPGGVSISVPNSTGTNFGMLTENFVNIGATGTSGTDSSTADIATKLDFNKLELTELRTDKEGKPCKLAQDGTAKAYLLLKQQSTGLPCIHLGANYMTNTQYKAIKQSAELHLDPEKSYLGTSSNRLGSLYATDIHYISSSSDSDRRIKQNIVYLNEMQTDKYFDALKPAVFSYKKYKPDNLTAGFIAQDVAEVPSKIGINNDTILLNSVDESNEILALNYNDFIALNTDQIQKLKKRVEELEQVIINLKKDE